MWYAMLCVVAISTVLGSLAGGGLTAGAAALGRDAGAYSAAAQLTTPTPLGGSPTPVRGTTTPVGITTPTPSRGTPAAGATSVPREGLMDVTGISARLQHSLALMRDGTVWAWGNNTAGQLGNETTMFTTSSFPVQVTGLTDATFVAAGGDHSLAATSDGTVWAWGTNSIGQLGDETTIDRSAPVQVSGGVTSAREVAAGQQHSLALRSDGSVWAWGGNLEGELGNGCQPDECRDQSTPVQVVAGIPS